MSKPGDKHSWSFAPRFRRGAFGWRSDPAITRIKEAVAEIKAASRKDALLAAEGAVLFLQKLSPALQNIDSSSGAIGNAVNRAIAALVPIIAKAPAETPMRRKWLEQLYKAHADDAIPYIESLGNYWGELCASPDLATEWAERLVGTVETIWSRSREEYGFFHGTIFACQPCSPQGGTNSCSPCWPSTRTRSGLTANGASRRSSPWVERPRHCITRKPRAAGTSRLAR
jgi:hypothetical protein